MKRIFLILFLITAVGLLPTLSLAQQSAPGVRNTHPHQRHDRWVAEHERMQQELRDMDQRLEQKLANVNSATGDQKIDAMADMLNEMVAQRKEMMDMFQTFHARMHGKMHGRMSMMREGRGMGSQSGIYGDTGMSDDQT